MYSVRLGYDTAINRIRELIANGHHPEALVTSMFTVEKTLRRTLRQIVVSAGFASKYADKIVRNLRGLDALKKAWELYEPNNIQLTTIIPDADWVNTFATWYNEEHRHSQIKFVTPQQRHLGLDINILEKRKALYEEQKNKQPSRWQQSTRDWTRKDTVDLNPEKGKKVA